MMSSEYKLFDGRVDFGQFLFDKAKSSATGRNERCQRTNAPRPIVKTNHNIDTTTTTTIIDTAIVCATTGHLATGHSRTDSSDHAEPQGALVSPAWLAEKGRARTLSCSSGGSDGGGALHCVFCKRNGETREFFGTHTLKDWRGKIVCPVLRAYKCPKCGATGDYAHTESHCPLSSNQPPLMSSLRTRRSSCGVRARYHHSSHH